jgi:hypothetical protein
MCGGSIVQRRVRGGRIVRQRSLRQGASIGDVGVSQRRGDSGETAGGDLKAAVLKVTLKDRKRGC